MTLTEPIKLTLTTSGGTISNTYSFESGTKRCRNLVHLFIKPTSSDTQYDIKITDKFDLDIFEETDLYGKYISTDPDNLPQYIYGNITLTISNATNDEDFDVLLIFREEH